MKDINLTTSARFQSAESRQQFNRLVKTEFQTFQKICNDKESAVHCAIWVTLQNHPELWTIGPCLEHGNKTELNYIAADRLTAAITAVLA